MAVLLLQLGICFAAFLLITPAYSNNCTDQKFSNNKVFKNCTHLPHLNSTLHWTYHSSNSTISVAFTAAPAAPSGWISWAINPVGENMAGAEALIAFKEGGAATVKPFMIYNYSSIVQTNLSLKVSDSSAEETGGVMSLFGTFQLPENMTKFNYIWQVGAAVVSGRPVKHEFKPANLNAKGSLSLMGAGGGSGGAPSSAPTGAPSSAPSGSPGSPSGGGSSGESRIRKSNMRFYLFLAFGIFMGFYI